MIPDIDIYRSANLLVKHHGQDAPIHAAMRSDALLEAGDGPASGSSLPCGTPWTKSISVKARPVTSFAL